MDTFLAKMEEVTKGTEKIVLDIQHIMHLLEKRFDQSANDRSERKRNDRRRIAQKCKTKRKKKQILSERKGSKATEIISSSDDDDVVVDILTDGDIL